MKASTASPPKQKRERTRFKSGELAHVWANEGSSSGHTGSRNQWFQGTAFNSYGTTIARILHTKKGERVYVRDHTSFSSITGRVQSKLWRAIPKEAITFSAGDGRRGQSMRYTPESLRDYYLAKWVHTEPKAMAHERAAMTVSRYHALDEAIRVCEVFGLPKKELAATRRRGKPDVEEAREICRLHEEKRTAKREAREAKAREHRRTATLSNVATFLEQGTSTDHLVYDWDKFVDEDTRQRVEAKIAQLNAVKIEAWRNGDDVRLDYRVPLMLRREADEVVSSQGARVPLKDAERTYRFIMKVKARGWHANGEQHAVGMYALRHVKADVIQVGCHTIAWPEVERFASSQGWTVSK